MKTGEDAVEILLDCLEEAHADYMLVGSFSSNYYGVSRATRDADFVLSVEEPTRQRLVRLLPPEFKLDPQVTFETVTGTLRQIIEVPSLPFKIELFELSNDPHDQERFRRRRIEQLMNRSIYLPTPEDVVIQKLRWVRRARRGKDFDDAVAVLAVQGEAALNMDYIEEWCARHDAAAVLAEARKLASLA